MSKLRTDWAWRMHMYLGYRVVEDEEGLRAFNKCIKDIKMTKTKNKTKVKKNGSKR